LRGQKRKAGNVTSTANGRIAETAQASAGVFRAILDLKGRIERDVLPRFSTRRQDNAHAFMRHLYTQPVVDVNMAAKVIGATTNTASALIADLVAYGVLTEVTGQRRNRLFVFNDYVEFFRK
jgi:Fic family protein